MDFSRKRSGVVHFHFYEINCAAINFEFLMFRVNIIVLNPNRRVSNGFPVRMVKRLIERAKTAFQVSESDKTSVSIIECYSSTKQTL